VSAATHPIGIDDAFLPAQRAVVDRDDARDARGAASELARLFPELYLRFHRRTDRGSERMTPESAGLLQHLALAGPLTIGEMARHLGRAQSVVSETVAALESRGLLARTRDPRDRRRALVWLTDAAHDWLRQRSEVLDPDRIAIAMSTLTPAERARLLDALRRLLDAAGARPGATSPTPSPSRPERRR
jgi:DNA-binding MarR family transcriptional regulator